MDKYKLSDEWEVNGTDLASFEEMIEDISSRTSFEKIPSGELKFFYRLPATGITGVYKIVAVTPNFLVDYEGRLALAAVNKNATIPAPKIYTLPYEKTNVDLAEESFRDAGFLMGYNNKPLYVSRGAKATLCIQADLKGGSALNNSLYMTQALCEALSLRNKDITMVVRTSEEGNKAFAFLSGKYEHIPMTVVPDVVKQMSGEGTLGTIDIKNWHIDQDFTSIYIELPDIAEDFEDMYGLADRVIPGLVIMTSDTGSSSIIVRGTAKKAGSRYYSIVDEYAHKHAGNITVEDILTMTDSKVMAQIRKLPEALMDKMGKQITPATPDTPKNRNANRKAVESAIKNGAKALGIRKILGQNRTKDLMEKLCAEIDPNSVYTEYDIAMLFLGLSDRVDGLPKELRKRLAETCGQAPFVKMSGKLSPVDKGDLVLLPEGEEVA